MQTISQRTSRKRTSRKRTSRKRTSRKRTNSKLEYLTNTLKILLPLLTLAFGYYELFIRHKTVVSQYELKNCREELENLKKRLVAENSRYETPQSKKNDNSRIIALLENILHEFSQIRGGGGQIIRPRSSRQLTFSSDDD